MKDHLAGHRLELIISILHVLANAALGSLPSNSTSLKVTLRRDLQVLEKRGLLRRMHGGAVPLHSDVNYSQRLEYDQLQKQAIGRAATTC